MPRQYTPRIQLICPGCNKPFEIKASHAKRRKFCSGTCRSDYANRKTKERFWSKVQKSESCWEWTAGTDKDGYGTFWIPPQNERAHRFSWMLHYGEITDSLYVLHKCDNPRCVRPSHLYLGTQLQNRLDTTRQNRQAQGSSVACAKLTDTEIRSIRILFARGVNRDLIADRFKINRSTVYKIARRETWKHVD